MSLESLCDKIGGEYEDGEELGWMKSCRVDKFTRKLTISGNVVQIDGIEDILDNSGVILDIDGVEVDPNSSNVEIQSREGFYVRRIMKFLTDRVIVDIRTGNR